MWNCDKYINRCINSVKNQTYQNWDMYVIDDCSNDNSGKVALNTIGNDRRITYIRNEVNLGGLVNYLKYIPELCNDEEDIICFLDGDDALYDNTVLDYLNSVYKSNDEIWLTYGDFIMDGGTTRGTYLPIPNVDVLRKDHRINLTHLKSLKYHLFKKIKPETFIDNRTGKVFDTVWDVIIMISAAQIAGLDRIKKIDKLMYRYNNSNNNSTVRSGNNKPGAGFNHLLETNFYFREHYTNYEIVSSK
jgi:glycosyltransferase involved in cell wall biosynthesis